MAIQFENTALPDIIELKDIYQEYDDSKKKGKQVVIKGLNLLIEDKPNQGQFVVILGKSGCGKSSILRYIAGLQKPTSGEVLIYGKPRTRNTKVSMVFQKYSSFPWLRVIENVEFGLMLSGMNKKERREKALCMVETVGLIGQENKYPAELSGGQQQRVAIARSLICNSSILLLDEPFSALDIYTRIQLQEFLMKLWSTALADLTIIMVTHDISEAVFLANEIWIMGSNPGCITERVLIDLPKSRTHEIRRDPTFLKYIYTIEDKMRNL